MKQVSQSEFFAAIGRLNAMPRVIGKYDERLSYRSVWQTGEGQIVGASDGGTHLCEHRYFLDQEAVQESRPC